MYELSPFSFLQETFLQPLCPRSVESSKKWIYEANVVRASQRAHNTQAPSDTEAPCLFKEWFRLSGPSADLIARKYLSLSSPTEPRASLNQLSVPLGDYRGFINEQGALFHTSYQTDHKTPSLGFDCLVTHVGAAPYGNAAARSVLALQRRWSLWSPFSLSFSPISLSLFLEMWTAGSPFAPTQVWST